MPDPLSLREAGSLRVRAAMDHVQTAQRELSRAMADLSSVRGYVSDGDRLRRLYDRVHAEWYRLNGKLERPARGQVGELDREPLAADADPHANGCGRPRWRPEW